MVCVVTSLIENKIEQAVPQLCPNFQVFVGDQATCKTIRGAKRWVESEVNEVDKLKWALEVPGMLHKVCNVLAYKIQRLNIN